MLLSIIHMQIIIRQSWIWILAGTLLILAAIVYVNVNNSTLNSEQATYRSTFPTLPPRPDFPYNIHEPTDKQKLPEKLDEVSGLTFIDSFQLGMVQDEKGKIYLYDYREEEVIDNFDFEDEGDFEGVEISGSDAYIIQSNGILYEVVSFMSKEPVTRKYKTPLTARNDVEGLGILNQDQKLILACKEEPGVYGKSYNDARALYVFDLKTQKMDQDPFILIDLREIAHMLKTYAETDFEKEVAEEFEPGKNSAFKPSATAVHPHTGEIYVLGTVGKLLLIFTQNGELRNVIPLDKDVFKQPEGICFAPTGTLFISNEGKNGKANLLIFQPKDH